MKKKRKTNKALIWIVLAAVILMALGIWKFMAKDPFQEGNAYLKALDEKDITETEKTIRHNQIANTFDQIESGEVSVFAGFSDSLLLGDSRMYGFQSYGFLPESRVMAAAGETFANATDYIDVVQTLQPDVLYFSYGINDLGLQLGGDAQGYADFVETQVKALLEVSPDSLVVINSIIEATAEANTQSDYWSLAPEYNEALKTMTEKNGWIYVDNSTLSGGGTADIYQADGIHFYSTFYPVWAQHMLEAAKDALLNS